MSAIQNAIEVRNLTKIFSGRVLFENFSLNVKANTIHAIIGPNGSGKTTLLRLITGCLLYTSGASSVSGNRFPDTSAGFSNAAFSVFPVPAGQWFFHIPASTVPKIFPCSHILC